VGNNDKKRGAALNIGTFSLESIKLSAGENEGCVKQYPVV
jgi:hypothetical protein